MLALMVFMSYLFIAAVSLSLVVGFTILLFELQVSISLLAAHKRTPGYRQIMQRLQDLYLLSIPWGFLIFVLWLIIGAMTEADINIFWR